MYITLTEAITEICEDICQKADVYIDARNRREEERVARFLESARARARALIKAGFDPSSELNALLVGHLPEVAAHRSLGTAHHIERDEEGKRLWQAGREIVDAGARDELVIRGRPTGAGKLEIIDAAELGYLAFNEITGFDVLYNKDTEYFWNQVTLEKASFAVWKLRVQKVAADPTIATETRALILLSECLKANDQLTRAKGKEALQRAEIPISDAGFLRTWPKARVKAGLPEKAAPGPKKPRS